MALYEKPLFTFEMANNHQGSVEHGLKIIRELKRVTQKYEEVFDFAIKFQYRDLDTFIHPAYKDRMDIKNVKRFQDTRLSKEDFLVLKEEVSKQGMYTMCTAFDEASVDGICEQGYDIIKIASCSFTDWPLLEKIATVKMPVIASAAGSSLEEIDKVVAFFKHRNMSLALMHCVAEYPTVNEHLEMNQITLYKNRYPDLRIGFSTHEDPNNMEPVKIAVAKGAEIFEKHVGVPTDEITLNGYSANPEQVELWLETAYQTYKMCGIAGRRYEPQQKEKDDLIALRRGVFAKRDIQPGEKVDRDDIYFAFPCQKGQLLANNISKYASVVVGANEIMKDGALMLDNVSVKDDTERIQGIVYQVMELLNKSNVVVPLDSTCQISHHYGLDEFGTTGVTTIDCINREYCKKILVMLPGQCNPTHVHKKKEETFTVLYGTLDLVCGDKKQRVIRGEAITVERGVEHSFSTETGCVFEEISTTHYVDDSFYENKEQFVNPRKTTVYLTAEMLRDLNVNL